MLAEELKKAIRGEVVDDEETREKFSTDASIFKIKPEVVVSPADTADLQALVRFVAARKQAGQAISLSARSAGTDMGGGPLTESVVVDFLRHFNRILEVGNDYAVAEPGVFFRDFEREIGKKNLMLPSYPASKGLCALGGVIANNSGGEKTLSYGKTEKYVHELETVLANGDLCTFAPLDAAELKQKLALKTFEGDIYRKLHKLIEDNYETIQAARPNVSKNSAGYFLWNVWDKKTFDVAKLIVGSQGTLALVTKAKFGLVPRKRHSHLAVLFLKDLSLLGELVNEVLKFNPDSFESFDDHTLGLAVKFMPDMIKLMKGGAIKLGFQFLPEMFMVLTGGVPKLVLLVEIADDDEQEIANRMEGLRRALARFPLTLRIMKTDAGGEKYWVMRRESFNLLRHKVRGKQTAPFIDDFIVRPEYLPEFLPRLNALLEPYGNKLTYTIAGHVGDGNFHIIPLMDLHQPGAKELIPKLAEDVYKLVLEYKGSTTAEHNDGLVRSPYLKMMYGDKIYALFEETKRIFDPQNILNPGKKVDADFAYAMRHLK